MRLTCLSVALGRDRTRRARRVAASVLAAAATACASHGGPSPLAGFSAGAPDAERSRVFELYPGVTATVVAPSSLDVRAPIELVLYALPNGNSTAETMGRAMRAGVGWRYDIQNIAAQTRALRMRGVPQAVVAYLEADTKSWPSWRSRQGYPKANARIVELVDQLRTAIGNPPQLTVTLTGHSGGGSFMFGFIEGQDSLPSWLHRIAFLDANYNFAAAQHSEKLLAWLRRDAQNRLEVLAYDDREITLDGKKVVSDSGGTWRATQRMLDAWMPRLSFTTDTLGPFIRYRAPQMELLRHPNPQNRILHTEMIGEMNGYLHAMLAGRPAYEAGPSVLKTERVYTAFTHDSVTLPAAGPPDIPPRPVRALSGTAFIGTIAHEAKDPREAATRREILSGNIPSFLRQLQTVTVTAAGADGVPHTVSYEVMPDYLSVGSDRNWVRMPMTPYTAQAFGDAYGFVLPTKKMVDDIWAAATVHVEPRPLTKDRDSTLTFLQHHRIIEEQLADAKRGALVAGIKKDVVVSNKLLEKPNRVAIYGWHYLSGQAIQPTYAGHVDWYIDYSHGIRPVRRWMRLDGVPMTFEQILADSTKRYLLSDEGAMRLSRYPQP